MQKETEGNPITRDVIKNAEKLIGLKFDDQKRDSMMGNLFALEKSYENIRNVKLANDIPPAILFNPIPAGVKFGNIKYPAEFSSFEGIEMPANIDDIAFYSIGELASLIKAGKISSMQLTRFYIERLKKYGPKLECVITLTEDLAYKQAQIADDEISGGLYKGPLHGCI